MKITEKEVRAKAEEHWNWLEGLLHKIYVDSFIHGFKHGQEMERKRGKKNVETRGVGRRRDIHGD